MGLQEKNYLLLKRYSKTFKFMSKLNLKKNLKKKVFINLGKYPKYPHFNYNKIRGFVRSKRILNLKGSIRVGNKTILKKNNNKSLTLSRKYSVGYFKFSYKNIHKNKKNNVFKNNRFLAKKLRFFIIKKQKHSISYNDSQKTIHMINHLFFKNSRNVGIYKSPKTFIKSTSVQNQKKE